MGQTRMGWGEGGSHQHGDWLYQCRAPFFQRSEVSLLLGLAVVYMSQNRNFSL